ncbi:MAG TPA: ABC transporter substrate-binding protein [Thermoleophilaceae bacterium]|nr:ABC transporter substrate-binding protein [Thermoleophilaceae bacterium]
MRRALPTLVVAAAALAVGCQSGFDEDRETAKPLKVAHALGESKVPGRAERPLALSVGALDATLALGVEPAGAALPDGRLPSYLRPEAGGLEVDPPLAGRDLPGVEALDPDVIVGSSAQGRLYDALSEIAPTVLAEGIRRDWKLDVRLFGEALGRTNAAERLLISWDEAAARTRRNLPDARVAVVRLVRGGTEVAGLGSFAGTVIADAGLKPAASAEAADVVLVSTGPRGGGRPTPPEAVRVDDEVWWEGDGLLAARAALRDLERALLDR